MHLNRTKNWFLVVAFKHSSFSSIFGMVVWCCLIDKHLSGMASLTTKQLVQRRVKPFICTMPMRLDEGWAAGYGVLRHVSRFQGNQGPKVTKVTKVTRVTTIPMVDSKVMIFRPWQAGFRVYQIGLQGSWLKIVTCSHPEIATNGFHQFCWLLSSFGRTYHWYFVWGCLLSLNNSFTS